MQQAELRELIEYGLMAVRNHQEDEVRELRDATSARLCKPRGKRVTTLPQQCANFLEVGAEHAGNLAPQYRRDVAAIKQEAVVRPAFGNPHDPNADERLGQRACQLETQTRMADFDRHCTRIRGVRIEHVCLGRFVSRQACGSVSFPGDFDRLRAPQRQGEADQRVFAVRREIKRWRSKIYRRAIKRRPIGQDAARFKYRDLAGSQRSLVDDQVTEPPEMRRDRAGTRLHPPFGMAVLLLEVLRLEKQAFGPNNLAEPGHEVFRATNSGCGGDRYTVALHSNREGGRLVCGHWYDGAPLRLVRVAVGDEDTKHLRFRLRRQTALDALARTHGNLLA